MAKQTVNVGSAANDGTGDTAREAFSKVNDNFSELYYISIGTYIAASKPYADMTLLRWRVTVPFLLEEDCAGSLGGCDTGKEPTSTWTATINKDDVEIGTLTIDTGDSTATFICDETEFDAGSVLTVVAPNFQDLTLEGFDVTLRGIRI